MTIVHVSLWHQASPSYDAQCDAQNAKHHLLATACHKQSLLSTSHWAFNFGATGLRQYPIIISEQR